MEKCRKKENFGYFVPFIAFYYNNSSHIRYCLLDFFYVIFSFPYSIYPLACSLFLKRNKKQKR